MLLFTYHRSHDLRCWNAETGRLVWEVDIKDTYGVCSSKVPQYWTPGNSPLVLGDKVVVSGYGTTGAVALNKRSGALVWRAAGVDDSNYDGPRPNKKGSNNWSSPTAVRIEARDCVVLHLSKDVVCVDAGTGEELWRYQQDHWPGPATVSDPVLAGKHIVVPGYRRGEGVGLVLNHSGNLVRKLPSLLISSGTPVWHDGWLFTHRDAVHVETNERTRMGIGAPILVDGKIILLGRKTMTLAQPDGGVLRTLGRTAITSDTWAAPVFSSGRILFRSGRTALACWDVRKDS